MENSSTLQSPSSSTFSSQRFPVSYFLDPNHFQPLPAGAFVSTQGLSESRVRSCLGPDIDAIRQQFFSTVHAWLPMLSKKRLLHLINNAHAPREESQSLLLLCMKLASGMDRQGARGRDSSLYRLAKTCCLEAEQGGFISLRLVQCMILVAVYELGNAIFPEAYLTIGQASRLGGLISLHNKEHAQQLFQPADTWTLREEHRRTWWAIFVLDKRVAARHLPRSHRAAVLTAVLDISLSALIPSHSPFKISVATRSCPSTTRTGTRAPSARTSLSSRRRFIRRRISGPSHAHARRRM